jgi:uncharacterized repeat protein (TIGR03803 family)
LIPSGVLATLRQDRSTTYDQNRTRRPGPNRTFVLAVIAPPAHAQSAAETVLYTFTANFPRGTNPTSGIIRDSAGNLYGTAAGGAFDAGIVYTIDVTGHQKVLYTFTGGADGGRPFEGGPSGDLTFDPAGNLYGTTAGGGTAVSETLSDARGSDRPRC